MQIVQHIVVNDEIVVPFQIMVYYNYIYYINANRFNVIKITHHFSASIVLLFSMVTVCEKNNDELTFKYHIQILYIKLPS